MFFYWDDKNVGHLEKYRVEPHEAEYVVRRAQRPYPQCLSNTKTLVKGTTLGGRWIQVIYVPRRAEHIDVALLRPSDRLALLEGEAAVYIIHARDLRPSER